MSSVLAQGFEQVTCPGCDEPDAELAYTGRDFLLASDTLMRVVRCRTCGLHYLNPRPDADLLGRYYGDDYAPFQAPRPRTRRTSVFSASLRDLMLRRTYAPPHLRPRGLRAIVAAAGCCVKSLAWCGEALAYRGQGRLLDFGCGAGAFLNRMARVGWEVAGLDASATAVEQARRSGLRALHGTLPHADLQAGSFDAITMLHSLEHVPSPRRTLSAAFDLLAEGGLLYILVPNFASWDVAHFGDAAMGLDLPRHLTHFTPDTLADLIRRCGFKDVRVVQEAKPVWLRKAAARRDQYKPARSDYFFRFAWYCRWIARRSLAAGRANQLAATAIKRA